MGVSILFLSFISLALGSPPIRDLSAILEAGGNVMDAAKVGPLPGINATSYSGFFNVNKTANAYHFFWYWPALNGNTSAPLIVFLQGGPGEYDEGREILSIAFDSVTSSIIIFRPLDQLRSACSPPLVSSICTFHLLNQLRSLTPLSCLLLTYFLLIFLLQVRRVCLHVSLSSDHTD